MATSASIRRCGRPLTWTLEAPCLGPFRAKPERIGQREQNTRAAARVVRRAVAKGHRHRAVGPQILVEEKPHSYADGGERKTSGIAGSTVPGPSGLHEAVELITAEVSQAQFLVETQFERAGDAVVAADLGAAVSSAKGRAAQIELLRGEQRPRGHLTRRRKLHRPGVGQRLIACEPEIEHAEFARRAVAGEKIVIAMRRTEDINTLAVQ